MKKSLLIVAIGAALTGCAGYQQVLSGYETSAIKGIQAADDNTIRVWSAAACGTPYSAAIRNPQVIPALKVLCLPAGADSSPALLFEVPVAK